MKAGKRKRYGPAPLQARLGRDKRDVIIRMCGVDGCSYKTAHTVSIANHKASKHNIEFVRKIPNDGKQRDKWGRIIRACGINRCSYKTELMNHMGTQKAAKYGINVTWHSCLTCNYKSKLKGNLTTHAKLYCPGTK